MKLNAKYNSHLFDNKGRSVLQLTIENPYQARMLSELEEDVVYSVEIKRSRSKRSIQSNAYLWVLLHKLEKITFEPAMDWYIKALIETGAVVDYVWGTEDTETTLKKSFRAVQKVKPHKIKDSDGWLYRVIVGSSKYKQEEMNRLIETVIRYCVELYIEVEEYQIEL